MHNGTEKLKKGVFFDYVKHNTPVNMQFIHHHKHFEIYYLISGNRKYFIGNRMITIQKGDVILIPPNIPHKTAELSSTSHERFLVSFKADLAGVHFTEDVNRLFSRYHMSITEECKDEFESIIKRIENEYRKDDKYSEAVLRGMILELIAFLIRNYGLPKEMEQEDTKQLIKESAEYINQHLEEKITLNKIAKNVSLSPSYFSKCFKAYTGMGFHNYLTYVRIMNAEKLLAVTHMPITEVAARCGFDDSNYFASVFKKHQGLAPLKFRKKM